MAAHTQTNERTAGRLPRRGWRAGRAVTALAVVVMLVTVAAVTHIGEAAAHHPPTVAAEGLSLSGFEQLTAGSSSTIGITVAADAAAEGRPLALRGLFDGPAAGQVTVTYVNGGDRVEVAVRDGSFVLPPPGFPVLPRAGEPTVLTVEVGVRASAPASELTLGVAVVDTDGVRTRRLSGANRYATAAAVADATHPDVAATVLLASGEDFPDALAAGPAAAAVGAPVLLSPSGGLHAATIATLERLAPDTIILIGGEAALSPQVAAQASAYAATVERIGGTSRVDTAARVALATHDEAATILLAAARDFPDALAGVPAAGRLGAPLLLSDADSLADAAADVIVALGADEVILLGGEQSLSTAVEAELATLVDSVRRVAGANRFATAAAVADELFEEPASTVLLASGRDFPDALSGGAAAAAAGWPLLMTGSLPQATAAALTAHGPAEIVAVGGPAALDEAALDAAALAACEGRAVSDVGPPACERRVDGDVPGGPETERTATIRRPGGGGGGGGGGEDDNDGGGEDENEAELGVPVEAVAVGTAQEFQDALSGDRAATRRVTVNSSEAADADLIIFVEEDITLTDALVYTGSDSLAITGEVTTILDGAGATRLLDASHSTAPLIVDGLTWTNGSATAAGSDAGDGGAILAGGDVTVAADGVAFAANTAAGNGGAIFSPQSHITIAGAEAVFSGNVAGSDGGAVAARVGEVVVSGAAVFAGNGARDGGAVWVGGAGVVTVSEAARFADNRAARDGGAIRALLGGVVVSGAAEFTGNEAAAGAGGAVWARAGTVTVAPASTFAGVRADTSGIDWTDPGGHGTDSVRPEPAHDRDDMEAAADCVDLNRAGATELTRIIHIGEVRAEAIIAGRPWQEVTDLSRISGIADARLADILEQGLAAVACR